MMKQGRNVPSMTALGRFNVQQVENVEGLYNPLYHYQTYPAIGSTQLTFFNAAVGQSGLTYDDTNMTTVGSLPAGQNFLATAIEVMFWPGGSPSVQGAQAVDAQVNDLWAIMKTGRLRLFVGSKDYLIDGPIGIFPAQSGADGVASAADVTTAGAALQHRTAIVAQRGPLYQITPIRLTANLNFNVYLEWATAVATPSTVAGRIGVRLLGFLYRKSQ